MKDIKLIQKEFFETLQSIQEEAICIALNEYKQGEEIESLLYNVTYEAICDILLILDGYKNDKLSLDIIENNNKMSLKSGIQLHDKCREYLKYEK